MNNVKISKYLVLFAIGLFIGASFIPSISSINNNIVYDEIDQQQENYDASTCLLGTMLFAQLFKPSFETLTRVKLFMNKVGNLYGNSILSIRDGLLGDDLTSVSVESIDITNELGWIEFDFPDIQVTPGVTYYIVLKPDPDSDGGNGFNYISWAFGLEDPYPKGMPFWKYNGSWSEGIPGQSSADYTFKTFGVKGNDESEPKLETYIVTGFSLLLVKINVENIGDETAHNVTISNISTGGNVIFNFQKSKLWSVDLKPGEKTVLDPNSVILGFGKFTISIEVTCDEGKSSTSSVTGLIFGPLIIIP